MFSSQQESQEPAIKLIVEQVNIPMVVNLVRANALVNVFQEVKEHLATSSDIEAYPKYKELCESLHGYQVKAADVEGMQEFYKKRATEYNDLIHFFNEALSSIIRRELSSNRLWRIATNEYGASCCDSVLNQAIVIVQQRFTWCLGPNYFLPSLSLEFDGGVLVSCHHPHRKDTASTQTFMEKVNSLLKGRPSTKSTLDPTGNLFSSTFWGGTSNSAQPEPSAETVVAESNQQEQAAPRIT